MLINNVEFWRGEALRSLASVFFTHGKIKGDTPLVSPAQRDSTPLDSPKGEKGILIVVSDVERRVPERHHYQTLLKGS